MIKRRWIFSIILIWSVLHIHAQKIEKGLEIAFDKNDNTTSTYWDVRQFYQNLGKSSPYVRTVDFGMTDIGQPLQEVVIAADGHFSPDQSRKAGKSILFINNGIHPGEPDGIDAMMLFTRDLVKDKTLRKMLNKVTIVVIPVYNIDGCLNRTGLSRPSQNGPELYGFRGNAKNLDLNRDFIKCDSKNALSFNRLFNRWSPDVLIDTHASNGSDYQHTFTLINTHKDRLQPILADYMTKQFVPYIYRDMAKKGWNLVPYVMSWGSPDKGIFGFMDTPRYSSGYAALHQTISFMPETHMLKPYKDRVRSTLDFFKVAFTFIANNKDELRSTRAQAFKQMMVQDSFTLAYTLDKNVVDSIPFQGFLAGNKTSLVSGMPRLFYDRSKPWEANIPYWNTYKPTLSIKKPLAYVVPQAYDHIINLMEINGVKLIKLSRDTVIDVEMYMIDDFETSKSPYEGHYPHSNVKVSPHTVKMQYYRGDYMIYTDQTSLQYIIQTLEPQAADSWFVWNAFDGFLSQKEYYSDYVFEDISADFLEKNPKVREELETHKLNDPKFREDGRAQLDFVYKSTPYYEPEYMRYPVGRIVRKSNL